MPIERLNGFHFPATQPSAFDSVETTVLELTAKTAYKVNECIDLVNQNAEVVGDVRAIANQAAQTAIQTMIDDGSIDNLINNEILGGINTDITDLKDTTENHTNSLTTVNSEIAKAKGVWLNIKNLPSPLVSCIGDGVADDTAAFQAAIDYVSGIGGLLWVPAGTYKITGTLTVVNNHAIKIIGSGQSTVVNFNGANIDRIVLNTASPCTIADMWLVAPTNETSKSVVHITASSNPGTKLIGLIINRGYNGIEIDAGQDANANGADGCVLSDQVAYGVLAKSAYGFRNGNINMSGAAGISWASGTGFVCENTDIFGCVNGVIIRPAAGATCAYGHFKVVTCESNGTRTNQNGWLIGGNGGTVKLVTLVDCWGGNNGGDGAKIDSGATGIELIGFNGINNVGYGVEILSSTEVKILGGAFAANNFGINVWPNASNFKIQNCRVGAWAGFAANTSYGVQIYAGTSDYYMVTGVDAHGNGNVSIQDGGTGTHKVVSGNLT